MLYSVIYCTQTIVSSRFYANESCFVLVSLSSYATMKVALLKIYFLGVQSEIKANRVKLRKKRNRIRTRFDSKSLLTIAIRLYSMAQILLDTKRQMRQIRARL